MRQNQVTPKTPLFFYKQCPEMLKITRYASQKYRPFDYGDTEDKILSLGLADKGSKATSNTVTDTVKPETSDGSCEL